MRLHCFLVLLLTCFSKLLVAQGPMPKVRHFNADNGYNRTGVIMDVKSDRKGNIWIVHHSGITRYNGHTFHEINTDNVPHRTFLRFYESYKNQPFVIDFSGGIFFIEGDSIRPYAYNKILTDLNSQNGYTDVYFDDENRLHIALKKSGYVIITDGEVSFPFEKVGKTLNGTACILREGNLPFMLPNFSSNNQSSQRQLYLFNSAYELIDQIDISKDNYAYPNAITQLPSGSYLYSSGRGNLIEFNQHEILDEIEFADPILNVLSDSDNGLWVSTVENGIHYFSNGKLAERTDAIYFKNTTSILSAEDYEGGLWIYSEEKGLNLISNPMLKFYNTAEGLILSDNVYAFDLIGDHLLAGKEGCTFSKINTITHHLDSVKFPVDCERYVYDIHHQSEGEAKWITQRGKVYYNQNGYWKEVELQPIETASNGIIIRLNEFGTSYKNRAIGITNKQYFYLEEDRIIYHSPIFSDFIYHVLYQPDVTWVSCLDGFYKVRGDSMENLATRFPVLNNGVNFSTYFDSKLWLNIRNKGVYLFQEDTLIPILFDGQQLMGATLLKKNEKELWIFANQGSFLFTNSEKPNHHSGTKITAFQPLYGFSPTEVRCNDSTVFFGTKNQGILRVEFKDLMRKPLSTPRLVFTKLKINDNVILPSDSIFQLKYNEGFIQISYVGISYKNQKVNYRYRMKELNEKWSYTNDVYIQYTTLPPGMYRFEIQVQLDSQPWSDSKVLRFEVFPPFWKTWYFITAVSLFAFLIGYKLIDYRFKSIKREKDLIIDRLMAEQRALRAQMDPHFVFNIVASAQYLILKNENEKANQFLDLFSRLMRSILDQSNQNYQSIKMELKFLEDYIQLEAFRLENKFDYQIETEGISSIENELIPPFFIQPFIENAIHHGLKNKMGKGFLQLWISREDPFIKVVIQDDGIGREAANKFKRKEKQERKSHGIRIIKERLALHHYGVGKNEVLIEDLKDGVTAIGTRVTIYIKIKWNESFNN